MRFFRGRDARAPGLRELRGLRVRFHLRALRGLRVRFHLRALRVRLMEHERLGLETPRGGVGVEADDELALPHDRVSVLSVVPREDGADEGRGDGAVRRAARAGAEQDDVADEKAVALRFVGRRDVGRGLERAGEGAAVRHIVRPERPLVADGFGAPAVLGRSAGRAQRVTVRGNDEQRVVRRGGKKEEVAVADRAAARRRAEVRVDEEVRRPSRAVGRQEVSLQRVVADRLSAGQRGDGEARLDQRARIEDAAQAQRAVRLGKFRPVAGIRVEFGRQAERPHPVRVRIPHRNALRPAPDAGSLGGEDRRGKDEVPVAAKRVHAAEREAAQARVAVRVRRRAHRHREFEAVRRPGLPAQAHAGERLARVLADGADLQVHERAELVGGVVPSGERRGDGNEK